MQPHDAVSEEESKWYVLRDLKRANSKTPAYKVLGELGFEIFTPMHWVLKSISTGGKKREYVPVIHGLLFVKSLRPKLEPVIDKTDTLQLRFMKGMQKTPMTVPANEMERFIRAVTSEHASCVYYSPEDIKPEMLGKKVVVVGGSMDGMVGNLLKHRGTKKKRLVLQLKDTLVASVEITDGYIQFI